MQKVDEQVSYQSYANNIKRRLQLRKQNFKQRQQDMFGGQRKTAQIKTIQKFIGKLKSQSKNFQGILMQLDTLNMSKYVDQISNIIATSITEKQITFYTEMATKLNTQYENVPSIMIKDIVKTFNLLIQSQQDNKPKIKSLFLYTVQLFVCGFSFSYKQVIQMIKKVFKSGKSKKNSFSSQLQNRLYIYCYSCTIFSVFLNNFSQIFTKKQPLWIQTWKQQGKQIYKFPQVIPIKTKDELTAFFSKYISQCAGLLKQILQRIKKYQSQLFECLRLDGYFNKQTEKTYVQVVEKFQITKKHLKQIAMSVSEPIQMSQLQVKITTIHEITARYINKQDNAIIFQDQFQKQIYEGIPQLVTTEQKGATEEQYKQFKHMLENCKNVGDSNEIAKAFNQINNKKNRKLLAKDILEYRKQYHLVTPYLCRIVAIVNINYKDIGQAINDLVFNQYQKIKDTQTTNFVVNDKKSRIMKYICQFTKFKVIDVEKTMNCIENIIDNLNGYNIEMIVNILENVGRYLHLSENSANRFTFLMKKYENVIKKKSLPILTTSQLINSINMLKPRKQIQKQNERQKTELQIKAQSIMKICVINYIDELMDKIDDIKKTQQGFNAIKTAFLKTIQNYDFMNNYNYAYVLQELNCEELSKYVVDRTVQNLILYLANGQNQKTILWSKFLAELYKYKILQRSDLFSAIQTVLKISTNQIGVIHTFCYIFQACLNYLDSKKIAKQNQRFMILVKFKQFIFRCKYIPMLQQYQILQIFDQYQPNLSEISNNVLGDFLQFLQNKNKSVNKEISYSQELDKYLQKKNLKKFEPKAQSKDTRGQPQSPEKTIKPQNNSVSIIQQAKSFQKELTTIMEENRKDYSCRIAKPMYLQKIFDKKKEKKKDGPCITVIGRSGNKFIKKDIIKQEDKKIQ